MKKKVRHIQIVSHCWNYSRLLTYQLSSLLLYPPDTVSVRMTVVCCVEDLKTVETVAFFRNHRLWPHNVDLRIWTLEKERLFRRAIGRNLVCLSSCEDVIWLTDCDYLFGPGCLDGMYDNFLFGEVLCYPRQIMKNHTHEIGDQYIALVEEPSVHEVDFDDFGPSKLNKAIGGVQLYRGESARRMGYLPNSKRWQQPAKTFQKCNCDVQFRKAVVAGRGTAIDVPRIYRLRHSQCGREVAGLEL